MNIEGILGIASEYVSAPDELQVGVELLLGNVIVVENRQVAQKLVDHVIQNNEPNVPNLKVVTLEEKYFPRPVSS